MLESKTEAVAEQHAAQGRIDRLAALATAADKPRSALARLDATEAQAFAAWSADPSLPVPTPDSAERTNLTRELGDAQARGDAASRALAGLRGEVEAATAKVAAVNQALNIAAATVALEEIEPLIAAARAAMATIVDTSMRGQALARILGAVAGPEAPAYSATWAKVTDDLRGAFYRPHVNEGAERAYMASVNKLLRDLQSDAGAKLEAA